jgi:hypothetical protein
MKTYGKYAAGLIALYLVVANGTKFGTAVRAGSAGGVNLVKAFQGR